MWLVVLGGESTFRMYLIIRSRTHFMVGAGEAPPVEKVGVGGVRIYEGNGGGDAGVAEEVAAG